MVSIRPATLPRIDRYFDWRGKDVSRLEGFSDAAFALMLTLLAVSSVVPDSFERLFTIMEDFFAFTLTFTQTQLLPVAIVALNSSVTPWWSLSAAALVSIAPLVVVAFVLESYLSRGNLAGAIR